MPRISTDAERLWPDQFKELPPSVRNAAVPPAADGWRSDTAETGDHDGSAEVIDNLGVGVDGLGGVHGPIIGIPNRLSIGIPTERALRLPYMSEWGERIRQRMDAAGLSQTELAKACGIKPASVNDWFSGKTKMIDGKNLVAAARRLNTTPEWIMTGRGVAEQSHDLGINLPMMSEALVSLDKALRKIGLEWNAAYVAPALLLAYRERLEHPATLDKTGYRLYDSLVLAQLQGQQERYERLGEEGTGGAEEAQTAWTKAGIG